MPPFQNKKSIFFINKNHDNTLRECMVLDNLLHVSKGENAETLKTTGKKFRFQPEQTTGF